MRLMEWMTTLGVGFFQFARSWDEAPTRYTFLGCAVRGPHAPLISHRHALGALPPVRAEGRGDPPTSGRSRSAF